MASKINKIILNEIPTEYIAFSSSKAFASLILSASSRSVLRKLKKSLLCIPYECAKVFNSLACVTSIFVTSKVKSTKNEHDLTIICVTKLQYKIILKTNGNMFLQDGYSKKSSGKLLRSQNF